MEMIAGGDITVLLVEENPGVYQTFHLVAYVWPDINIWGWREQICLKS